jgi:magnesium chelatase accessory protein
MNTAEPLNWEREGRDWPNRSASQFVRAGGLRWHVQIMPRDKKIERDVILLVHGTGAATHSWRNLMPMLAKSHTVVAIDLPGHGFTEAPAARGFSLPEMATSLAALLKAMAIEPAIVAGHSAGAAILARMCIDGMVQPKHLVSVNGALLPLQGLPGEVFSPIAKLLSRSTLVPRLFAWRASKPAVLDRLLDGTGSRIDEIGRELYGTVISNAQHAAAALAMMAQWNLRPLASELYKLNNNLLSMTLVVGDNDKTVPPREAKRAQAILQKAKIIALPNLGHLAHEEAPAKVCEIILRLSAGSVQTAGAFHAASPMHTSAHA